MGRISFVNVTSVPEGCWPATPVVAPNRIATPPRTTAPSFTDLTIWPPPNLFGAALITHAVREKPGAMRRTYAVN
jgi:hypothetical protein